jgi:murein DD-endopeptidase MepM/ murein hydrolase activator NlpD
MGKRKFKYNPETCRYEPFYVKGKDRRQRVLIFLSLSFCVALGGYFGLHHYFETIDEVLLEQKNKSLKVAWTVLHQRKDKAYRQLSAFVDKDDNNYRVILDSNPLSPTIREAGVGGSEKINVKGLQEFPLILNEYRSLEKLNHQLEVEMQSYGEIDNLLDKKISMWLSRPAIQPINNEQLEHLHLTFGARMHPIFKVWKDHKGLDFTAALGTPVYATGDGRVEQAYYSSSYGNVIYLNHGYEYETRYAHMSRFAVGAGDRVKRGQVIGYVGNTGNSVSDHLHYEVLYRGIQVNPINFFQRDLSNEEYEKLIEIGSRQSEPLD